MSNQQVSRNLFLCIISFYYIISSVCSELNIEENDSSTPLVTTPESEFQCTHAGIACDCSDLTNVYSCIAIGDTFVPQIVDTCTSPQVCMESAGGCAAGPNPECNPPVYTMVCTSEGMFPHPYDCRRYYVCVSNAAGDGFESHLDGCTGEYGYDPLSTYCKLKLNSGKCSGTPIPVCTKSSVQPIPIASNPSMFYLCGKTAGNTYQPTMYRCPHGEKVTQAGCGSPDVSTSVPPSSPQPQPHYYCQPGDVYIPDYIDCTSYYDCTTSMSYPDHKSCPNGDSFNKITMVCEKGFANC